MNGNRTENSEGLLLAYRIYSNLFKYQASVNIMLINLLAIVKIKDWFVKAVS